MAKQLISFDDEDSLLSSSLPSSSGSVTSDTNSIQDLRSSNPSQGKSSRTANETAAMESSNSDRRSSASNDTNKNEKRKISIEISGARRKYSTSLEGPLTPVTSTPVGELTPVSQKDFEQDNISDDTVEISTDISAVLTVVENKNREEVGRLQCKISGLCVENETLKEQLKKYVSAVQMLQRDDESLDGMMDGLDVQQPDYKNEAKVYERKLVQVRFRKPN